MKTNKTFVLTILTAVLLAGLFFSCGVPVSLGSRLDVDGPVVAFTRVTSGGKTTAPPEPRMPVLAEFVIEGTASDFSGVDRLLVWASLNRQDVNKKWQWSKGLWEVYEDGAWRQYPEAEWNGTPREANWTLPIDLRTNNVPLTDAEQGQYVFYVQAWDTAEFSDDNSFGSLPLVVDQDPPKVSVPHPYLYPKDAYQFNTISGYYEFIPDPAGVDPDWAEITRLDGILDTSDPDRFNPTNIGKFITQGFLLQWQIEDNEDIGKIELRLYPCDTYIDNSPLTPLPNTHIYSYIEDIDILGDIKPNGSVEVPRLTQPAGTTDAKGGVINAPITEKTTIRVVATCYDVAGNANQEKTLGFFVYWPLADEPWITFNGSMEGVTLTDFYPNKPKNPTAVFMIYPGRDIKATAYQAHEVRKVVYSVYKVNEGTANNLLDIDDYPYGYVDQQHPGDYYNVETVNSKSSTIFPWEFRPPPRSGYYVIKVKAYGVKGADNVQPESTDFASIFRVQDISFPEFHTPVRPAASEPLFQFITRDNGDGAGNAPANSIRISGRLSDATAVTSLTMVWINPKSANYAAMSQLAYFRDQDYHGWKNALTFNAAANGTGTESHNYTGGVNVPTTYPYDGNNPNRLWNLRVDPDGEDSGPGTGNTGRKLYKYSVNVNLNDLNIGNGAGQNPLESQVFLLRVANPDNKCTIITYAPQGDTLSPVLDIEDVKISVSGNTQTFVKNRAESQMDQFGGGEEITVNGTWQEDSVEYLNLTANFKDKMVITINGKPIPGSAVTVEETGVTDKGVPKGTWKAEVTVSADSATGPNVILKASDLTDTFVVSAEVWDIGGNKAEAGSAWLIKSDTLKLMRISSDVPDGTFNAGKIIRFFLEFNKSVQLTYNNPPRLTLNTGGIAAYDTTSGLGTRQYFTYEVVAGHDTTQRSEKYLNVTGLDNPGTWSAVNYAFTWHRGTGEAREEIRVTQAAQSTPDGSRPTGQTFYTKKIPVSTTDSSEAPFTLAVGKNIEIDTGAPQVESIVANNQPGYYGTGSEIYITVKFNKAVKIGDTIPRLTLNVGRTASTEPSNDYVRINDRDVTFVYRVASGDVAVTGTGLVVTGHAGDITDLAGTAFPGTGISGRLVADRTLTGRFVDTLAPAVPTVRLLSASNVNSVVTNTFLPANTTRRGESGASAVDLTDVYNANLWLAIEGSTTSVGGTSTGAHKRAVIEYSVNNGGWVKAGNITNTPWALPDQPGVYSIVARQTDLAGNVSANTNPVRFNWDKGNIITRISSGAANGIYTQAAGRNSIPITVYFRKPVTVTATTGIRLNALRGTGNGTQITVSSYNGTLPLTNVSEFTFNYTVEYSAANNIGDRMPTGSNVWLNVASIQGISARDANGVDVSSLLTVLPAAGSSNLLNENKQIKVETGALTYTAPAFIADNQGGTGYNDPANANFHGIRTDDGSYWTTLEIPFNHTIYKGEGNITIQQIAGVNTTAYRLPSVLTETQYNRFRGVANFDSYYTKGTNGYLYTDANNQGSDTTAKYILNYSVVPSSTLTGTAATFATAFREAEGISLSVNSAAVTIDGSTLKVRLSGSNAPQVPGASYAVTVPAGFVTDYFGERNTAISTTPALRGVAKPFVRVRKTQDTIATATAGNSQPRLTATQPFQTQARIDCRTPGSAITYTANGQATNVSAVNWSVASGPDDNTTPQTTRPANATATNYTNGNTITVGDDNNYNGYMWWIRAQATAGGNTSSVAEEVAYRTAITYRLRQNNQTAPVPDPGSMRSILANGDQIWIRGGDAIGSSSIPGFPLTWEDNFSALAGKRAGIRLMTKVNVTTSTGGTNPNYLNNSQWRFLTWEINATAYVDFIRGRDTTSTADIAWQYGPLQSFYQADGWTSSKDRYPIYPGKHRWCDTGNNDLNGKGSINFSGTPIQRNTYTVNNPDPWTGVNTATQGN